MDDEKEECIRPEDVPCKKVQGYLKKRGLLCGVQNVKRRKEHPASEKKSRLASFIDRWFG